MNDESGASNVSIELLERAAQAGAQLLKVDSCPAAEHAEQLSMLLLTFDVGRLLVRPEPERDELAIDSIDASAPLPPGLVDALEEEPWWRLLGNPLARVWAPETITGSVCLQFREDDSEPRIVTLEARSDRLSVTLENPPT